MADLFSDGPDGRADARDRATVVRGLATAADVAARLLRIEPLDPRSDVSSGMVAFACPGFANADGGRGCGTPVGRCALLASAEGPAARCICGLWWGDSIELVRVCSGVRFGTACSLIEAAFPAPSGGPDLFSNAAALGARDPGSAVPSGMTDHTGGTE
jgi:hypothetical protein